MKIDFFAKKIEYIENTWILFYNEKIYDNYN